MHHSDKNPFVMLSHLRTGLAPLAVYLLFSSPLAAQTAISLTPEQQNSLENVFRLTGSGTVTLNGSTDPEQSADLAISLTAGTNVNVAFQSLNGLNPFDILIRDPEAQTVFFDTLEGNQSSGTGTFTAPSTGTYTATIFAPGSSSGTARLDISTGLTQEQEIPGQVSNQTPATAEPIPTGVSLGPLSSLTFLEGYIGPLLSDVPSTEPNNTVAEAQNIDPLLWSLTENENIADSTTIPHITITGEGTNTRDVFSFAVTQAGARVIFDIDTNRTVSNLDSFLRLFDNEGQQITTTDDSNTAAGGGGSTSGLDSFLDTTLEPGRYFIEVTSFPGNSPVTGSYRLHISVEGHRLNTPADSIDTLDLYSIDLAQGENIEATVQGLGAESVTLQDENGTLLSTANEDSIAALSARLTYTSPAASRVFLSLSSQNPATYRATIGRNTGLPVGTDDIAPLAPDQSRVGFLQSEPTDFTTRNPERLNLTDSLGFLWDIEPDGQINNGTSDAFDGGLRLSVLIGDQNASLISRGSGSSLLSDDGREVYNTFNTPNGDLSIQRRAYVPLEEGSPLGFCRFIETFQNTGDTDLEITAILRTNLGSDSGTQLVSTSSGDQTFSTDDNWIITDDGPNGDPTVLHVMHGNGSLAPTAVSTNAPGNDDVEFRYTLTIPAGRSQAIMHFSSQDSSISRINTTALSISDLGPEFIENISRREAAMIVNFSVATDFMREEGFTTDEFALNLLPGPRSGVLVTASLLSDQGSPAANQLSLTTLNPDGSQLSSTTLDSNQATVISPTQSGAHTLAIGTDRVATVPYQLTVDTIDLALSSEFNTTSVTAGPGFLPLIQTVTITNPSAFSNENVMIQITPSTTEGVSTQLLPSEGEFSEETGLWTISAIGPGEDRIMELEYTFDPNVAGNTNFSVFTAITTSSIADPQSGNDQSNGQISVIRAANLSITSTSSELRYNPQTNLLEQNITLTNSNSLATNQIQIAVPDLPAGAILWNSSGSLTDGTPYILLDQPLGAGEQLNITLSYYSASGSLTTTPAPSATLTPAEDASPIDPSAPRIPVTRTEMLENGTFLLEWASTPDKRYRVLYSDSMTGDFTPIRTSVQSFGTRTQWIDSGPPLTPASTGSRFYRIIELPSE